ncbi:RCC1 domain-containing protein [Bdellovibrio reynosensis]|uniref:RCC1-like domain-containing protein n=1 Tax=Bdellovibrio reynosensis TaxID=2835041 RepID=A0ABY4C942_9BACT|nr:hypothetical protein [Bdellovibrio reynosensis]UOF01460.1 hypothetical protein MNR06_00645 [Bdellovibrio reynosensis]
MGRLQALIERLWGSMRTYALLFVCFVLAACSAPKAEDYQAKEKIEKPTGSININDGAASTTSLGVTVKLSSSVATEMYVTNTAKCTGGGAWETLTSSKSWTLTKTGVSNTIYAKFKDAAGIESNCYSASITHVVSGSFSLASPASTTYINSSNVANFTLIGGCVNEGQNVTIKVTGFTDQTAVCTNGAWTKTMNLTSHADGSVTFTLTHSDLAPLYRPFRKDTSAPTASTFAIAGGAPAVSSLNTTLAMTATNAAEMYISNTSCSADGTWETFATSKNWTLATADTTNTVYFKVRDLGGNESNCLNDSILHDSVVPTVTIGAPVAGTWINNINNAAFALSGTCSEVGATVNLSITGQSLTNSATCSALNTWSVSWNLSTLADNAATPYQIIATLSRPSGNQGTGSKSYYKDVVLPTAPTFSNLPALSANTTNITVSSADATHYRYLIIEPGDISTCTDTTAAFSSDSLLSASLVYALTNQGGYKVCARSIDAAGNVSLAVTAGAWTRDTQAPSVLAVSASNADGTYDVASVITVKITFDEAVIVTGNPTLTLETGTVDRTATYSAGSNSKTLSFTYTVATGDAAADLDYVATTSLSLAGGTIKDANNFNAILTLPAPGNVNSLAGQKNIAIVDAGNLVPTLSDYPTGNSSDTSLYVGVSGGTITQYKYAIITSGSCASATFSAATPKTTRITASLTGYADGSNMKLCVVGGNASNTFQNNNSATVVSWVKDARVFASITSPAQNRVVEGGANQIITISLSAAKATDVTVYYRIGGDAVNPTHHNLANGSVVISAGSTSQTVTLSLPENAVADGEKLLNFHITGAIPSAGVTLDKNYQAQFYIRDNDSAFSVSKFAMGRSHACAITSDNALRCYGHNSYGQVGDGTNLFKETGVIIKPGTSFAQVAVGHSHTCAVTTLGALYCWGDNSKNQLGDTTSSPSNVPVAIDIANSYLSVSAGANHTCAITTTNKLRCWGYNFFSNLGDGSNLNSSLPINIDAAENYSYVAAGSESTCAITVDGYLKCWGRNASSQLGNGGSTTVTSPTAVDASVKYKNVAMGSGHACGVTLAGIMKCWGANTVGQLGNNSIFSETTPVEIDNLVTYNAVTVNDDSTLDTNQGFTCGVTLANTLKCWGHNALMQLADNSTTNRLLPVASDSGTLYSSVIASGSRACGVSTAGGLKCWGSLDGEKTRTLHPLGSGNGGKYFINRFKNISLGFNFPSFSGYPHSSSDAASFSCAVESNKLYCWGTTDALTTTGDGTGSVSYRRPAPIWIDPETQYSSVSPSHVSDMCALALDGTLKCWGKNDAGELGLVTKTADGLVYRPKIADPTAKYSSVAVGSTNVCGITQTGILKCMGENEYGQVGDGSAPSDVATMTTVDPGVSYLSVVIGQAHACGITSGNILKCWGQNTGSGIVGNNSATQVNTPTVIDFGVQYKKVSAGPYSTCGITLGNKLKCWGFAGTNKILGFNDSVDRLIPTLVDSYDYKDVQVTETHACAIRSDDELYCWGQARAFGYFTGNLEALPTAAVAPAVRVDTGITYGTLNLRSESTCAKTLGGQWRCAGRFLGDNLGTVDSGRNNTVSITAGQFGFHNPTFIHKDLGF